LVKTLGGQILRLSGFVNPYSQVKWIFSTKMAQNKALILLELNSHAKMAPDSGLRERLPRPSSSADLVKTLGGPNSHFKWLRQPIFSSYINGYSQLKWLSIKH